MLFLFLFMHLLFYSKGDFITPLKWISITAPDWYYEQSYNNEQIWRHFKRNKFAQQLTQVSIDLKKNGACFVILRSGENIWINLTNHMAYVGQDSKNINQKISLGYWLEKSKGDFTIPFKWMSTENTGWYFERRYNKDNSINDSWLEYKNNTPWQEFRQALVDYDSDGSIFVLLWKKEDEFQIKLSSKMAYIRVNLLTIFEKLSNGYWLDKRKADLEQPLTWMADPNWYFKRQKNLEIWYLISNGKFRLNFTQISFELDANHLPIILLKRIEFEKYVKLTGYMSFWADSRQNVDNQLREGSWIEKKGKKYPLPNECSYISYKGYSSGQWDEHSRNSLLCENNFDERMMRTFAKTWREDYSLRTSILEIVVKKSKQRQIIDHSFGIFQLPEYMHGSKKQIDLTFLGVKGFDIESMIFFKAFCILKFHSDFNLYKQAKIVKNCEEFNNSDSIGFIFHSKETNIIFAIDKPKSVYPICSLFFRHARLSMFQIVHMSNSYLFKNQISFVDSNETDLYSYVQQIIIVDSYNIDLNSKLLNPYIFIQTTTFSLPTHINSIETTLFRNFLKFRGANFIPVYFTSLIRKQGIDWIKNINWYLNVDLRDSQQLESFGLREVKISFEIDREFSIDSRSRFAYEKDFCLFRDFPFNQLVFIAETQEFIEQRKQGYSCTEIWLYQHFQYFISIKIFELDHLKEILSRLNFTSCHFQSRLALCNKSNFSEIQDRITREKLSAFDYQILIEFIIMIAVPLLAAYGILTNLIIIYVIFHKDNKQTTREKHYIYMSLHCIFNTIICFIQILNLISDCQYPLGLYCSSIRHIIAVQYIKIILVDYTSSVCRLLSNFSYLGFSFCRMSKIGKDHGKLIVFVNDVSIKKLMISCSLISATLSVCKALQYDINLDKPEYAYPQPFIQNVNRFWILKPKYIAIVIINSIYDLLNYILFLVFNIISDLVLVAKLGRVLKEKEKKIKDMKVRGLEESIKENRDCKRRIISVVIFSSLFNLITRIPSTITSLNDVRLLIAKSSTKMKGFWFSLNWYKSSLTLKNYCMNEKICVVFQNFGSSLFLLSICSTIHIFKLFDKNFQAGYENVFKRNKS